MKTMSMNQQTKIQRGIMKPLFEASNIVNGFNFNFNDEGKIVVKRSFEEIGMLNILNNFTVFILIIA